MCGRFTLALEHERLLLQYGFADVDFTFRPRYNIAPMQESPVVALDDGRKVLQLMRWGLVPSWSKDETIGNRLINARAETVREKPSFRTSFKRRRCLVPATGYFEWKELPGSLPTKKLKAPMYFTVRDGEPFSFAGLWDTWERFDGKRLSTFTIITTEPNTLAAQVHNRMPVILQRSEESMWLEGDDEAASSLLRPYPETDLSVFEVSKVVNSPRNDSPECIVRVA